MNLSTNEVNIRECAVRIRVGRDVGSGFLFVPEGSSNAYIFTVYHVIKNLIKAVAMDDFEINWKNSKVDCTINDLDFCILNKDFTEEKPYLEKTEWKNILDTEYEKTKYEASVIRLPVKFFDMNSNSPKLKFWLKEDKLFQTGNFFGYGFPNQHVNPISIKGTYLGPNEEPGILNYQRERGNSDSFEDEVAGYSGTGLIMEYMNSLVLTGFVIKCKCNEVNGVFSAVKVSELIYCMQKYGWETPIEYNEERIPESFLSQGILKQLNGYTKYMDIKTKNCITQEIYALTQKCTPMEIAANEMFYDVPQCQDNRKSCNCYWAGRIWQLFVESVLNRSGGVNYYFAKDGKKIEFVFICSEGTGNADIGEVVKSAVTSQVLGNEIKGDRILFWQSSCVPEFGLFSKERFKNIVFDIANADGEGYISGYHLLNGEMQTKNYGILHRNYLAKKLDGCENTQEMKLRIEGVLDEIWG